MKENIYLEGIVLHSPDIDKLREFYECLLEIQFNEEKHEVGPKHYFGCENGRTFLELYPTQKKVTSPYLIFNVSDLETTLERMKIYIGNKVEQLPSGAKIKDPDGRLIFLHRRK